MMVYNFRESRRHREFGLRVMWAHFPRPCPRCTHISSPESSSRHYNSPHARACEINRAVSRQTWREIKCTTSFRQKGAARRACGVGSQLYMYIQREFFLCKFGRSIRASGDLVGCPRGCLVVYVRMQKMINHILLECFEFPFVKRMIFRTTLFWGLKSYDVPNSAG